MKRSVRFFRERRVRVWMMRALLLAVPVLVFLLVRSSHVKEPIASTTSPTTSSQSTKVAGATTTKEQTATPVPTTADASATETNTNTPTPSVVDGQVFPDGKPVAPVTESGAWSGCNDELKAYYTDPNHGNYPPIPTETLGAQWIDFGGGYGDIEFTSPDGMSVLFVGTSDPAATASLDGAYGPTRTVHVTSMYGVPPASLSLRTMCHIYIVPLQYYVPTPTPLPLINVTGISYDQANNSILYTVDRPITSLSISYQIENCQSGAVACSGYSTVATTALSGSFSLDPYFPGLDQYFAVNPATNVQLAIWPNSSEGLSVGNAGLITFYVQ